jgi:hypothetical protein
MKKPYAACGARAQATLRLEQLFQHQIVVSDAGGGLVSHRRFYLFIAGFWIGGGLMLWAAIHLMHVYAFD